MKYEQYKKLANELNKMEKSLLTLREGSLPTTKLGMCRKLNTLRKQLGRVRSELDDSLWKDNKPETGNKPNHGVFYG